MRIYVRDEEKTFWIPVPLWVLKLGTGKFIRHMALKYTPEEQRKYIEGIDFGEIRKGINVLSHYKGLELVHVESKDGSQVSIEI